MHPSSRHCCIYLVLFFLIFVEAYSQQSGNVRFLSHYVSPQGGAYTAGCWGWTDTVSGREYALLGNRCGTSIVEITDPDKIVERDFIPGVCSSWREIQTHSHYAYVVSEGGKGTQIIDLSPLPDSARLVKNFVYKSGADSTDRAHSIHIKDGYMYLNGCAHWAPGGIVIFDLANPENPVFKSEYAGNYIHDCFVRNNIIYGAAIYGVGIDIIDISNKSFPQYLSTISYAGAGTHNCATTTDGQYLLTTDEIASFPAQNTLKVWDLSTHSKVAEYDGDPTAIVHNVFVRDSLAIMSYYTAGLKVVNISDPTNPIEVGGYDTYAGSGADYTGAWSTYPFFPSGRIIIGDMVTGMYMVDLRSAAPAEPKALSVFSDYQTPTSAQLTWQDAHQLASGDPLDGSYRIHIMRDGVLIADVDSGVQQFTDTGLLQHQRYEYRVKTVTDNDSSVSIIAIVYAGGHPNPGEPSNIQVSYTATSSTLTWKNPSTQRDGTALNDLAYILIYRDGLLLDSLVQTPADTGQTRSFTDTLHGYHSYQLQSEDNETPVHYSNKTAPLFIYNGLTNSYYEDFENGSSSVYRTGTWDTVSVTASTGTHSFTDSPGGNFALNSESYFMIAPVIISPGMALRFDQIALIKPTAVGTVEVSTDHNKTFTYIADYNGNAHPQWRDYHLDPGDWFTESIPLDDYINDTLTILFRLKTYPGIATDGWYIDNIVVGPATGIHENAPLQIPTVFALEQNYPNPFNPSTTFRMQIAGEGFVTLKVFNVLGEEVADLVHEKKQPGEYSVRWNAEHKSSGMYFAQLTVTRDDGSVSFQQMKKLQLLK